MVSLSGGKDSTAMLLRMLEEGMRVDIILFCDTGLEFPAMYEHLDKLERDIGRPITRIRSFHTFEYYLTQKEILVKHKKNAGQRNYRGYGWSGPLNRWCTKELKTIPREKFLRQLQEHYDIIEYVGLAADEGYRFERGKQPEAKLPSSAGGLGHDGGRLPSVLLRPWLYMGRPIQTVFQSLVLVLPTAAARRAADPVQELPGALGTAQGMG